MMVMMVIDAVFVIVCLPGSFHFIFLHSPSTMKRQATRNRENGESDPPPPPSRFRPPCDLMKRVFSWYEWLAPVGNWALCIKNQPVSHCDVTFDRGWLGAKAHTGLRLVQSWKIARSISAQPQDRGVELTQPVVCSVCMWFVASVCLPPSHPHTPPPTPVCLSLSSQSHALSAPCGSHRSGCLGVARARARVCVQYVSAVCCAALLWLWPLPRSSVCLCTPIKRVSRRPNSGFCFFGFDAQCGFGCRRKN